MQNLKIKNFGTDIQSGKPFLGLLCTLTGTEIGGMDGTPDEVANACIELASTLGAHKFVSASDITSVRNPLNSSHGTGKFSPELCVCCILDEEQTSSPKA